MKRLTSALLLACFAASGCVSSQLSKSECLVADWRTVGYEDGAAGRGADRIGRHRKACADAGVQPDLVAYQAGREAGLAEYCRAANGYRVGLAGGSYAGICPVELAAEFESAYAEGHDTYVRQQRLNNTVSRLASSRRQLEEIEKKLVAQGLVVLDSSSTTEQRALALTETKQLAERKSRLQTEIAQLEVDRRHYERELEAHPAPLAYVR
jgi:hypothetical protein